MFRLTVFITLFSSFLFGDPFEYLDQEIYAENYESKLYSQVKDIDSNINEVRGLTKGNLNCINGTELIIQNRICYETFLAIKEVVKDRRDINELTNILIQECPEIYNLWAEFDSIGLCK